MPGIEEMMDELDRVNQPTSAYRALGMAPGIQYGRYANMQREGDRARGQYLYGNNFDPITGPSFGQRAGLFGRNLGLGLLGSLLPGASFITQPFMKTKKKAEQKGKAAVDKAEKDETWLKVLAGIE